MFKAAPKPAVRLGGDYQVLATSFKRGLLAENKAPRAVQTYLDAIDRWSNVLTGDILCHYLEQRVALDVLASQDDSGLLDARIISILGAMTADEQPDRPHQARWGGPR